MESLKLERTSKITFIHMGVCQTWSVHGDTLFCAVWGSADLFPPPHPAVPSYVIEHLIMFYYFFSASAFLDEPKIYYLGL